jgi:hypothetical protein
MAATTTLRRLICLKGIALLWLQAGLATASDPKPPPPAKAKPVDKEAWNRKLAGLAKAGWREAFAVGADLTELPADELRWHGRIHPHFLDVLDHCTGLMRRYKRYLALEAVRQSRSDCLLLHACCLYFAWAVLRVTVSKSLKSARAT